LHGARMTRATGGLTATARTPRKAVSSCAIMLWI
jgi:hypothetical protein